jgi:RNA polymerase sigma factor (TIGR02999 family)
MKSDVTTLLLRWSDGDQEALDELTPIVYSQLKEMARGRLRRERPGHTLNTTGLVHEAYIRLADVSTIKWEDRSHFLGIVSKTMRRVLIDHARKRNRLKRGEGAERQDLSDDLISDDDAQGLIELDDVLDRLSTHYPRHAEALSMRYFGGLTLEETASVLGISAATAMRDVRFAEAWIARAWGHKLDQMRRA